MLIFDKATYLLLLIKFTLSERLNNSLWRSEVLLFYEFINIVSILYYNCIEFIILLHTKNIRLDGFHLVNFLMY